MSMRQPKPVKEDKADVVVNTAVSNIEKVGKFPRESVYDNVAGEETLVLAFGAVSAGPAAVLAASAANEAEVEDEGIDNYYSDDSGSSPKVCFVNCITYSRLNVHVVRGNFCLIRNL